MFFFCPVTSVEASAQVRGDLPIESMYPYVVHINFINYRALFCKSLVTVEIQRKRKIQRSLKGINIVELEINNTNLFSQ